LKKCNGRGLPADAAEDMYLSNGRATTAKYYQANEAQETDSY